MNIKCIFGCHSWYYREAHYILNLQPLQYRACKHCSKMQALSKEQYDKLTKSKK